MTDKKITEIVKNEQKKGEYLSRSPAPENSPRLFASLDDAQNALPEWQTETTASDLQKRSAGRPKGAENIIGRKLRDYYFSRGLPNPLIQMGQILNMTPQELAKSLHCTVFEAFKEQQKIREAAARFIIPVASTPVDADGNALPQIMVINTQDNKKTQTINPQGNTPWDDNITILEGVYE